VLAGYGAEAINPYLAFATLEQIRTENGLPLSAEQVQKNYLKALPDACFETSDLLANGITVATPHLLDEFVNAQSQFLAAPADLVFQEAASRVVDSKGKPAEW